MSTFRIGIIRPLPRHSVKEQRARLDASGCDKIVVEGEKLPSGRHVTWDWMLRHIRAGDAAVVVTGRVLLQPQKGTETDTPRRRFFRGLNAIEAIGATVETADGKMHTRDKKSRDEFTIAVLDEVAKARAGGDAGRPKNQPEPEEISWMLPIWTSLRIPTNQAARDKIRAEAERRDNRRWRDVSVSQLSHKLGPSGRVALKRKPAKKAKK